jgi:hypothetical protein
MIHLNRNPSPSQLRLFARLWLPLFGLALGAVCYWRFESGRVAVVVWIATAVAAAAAIVSRSAARVVFLGLSYVTYPVGLAVSWIALAVLYFGVMTPLALAMRAMGRDVLLLRHRHGIASHWHPRADPGDPAHPFRQF